MNIAEMKKIVLDYNHLCDKICSALRDQHLLHKGEWLDEVYVDETSLNPSLVAIVAYGTADEPIRRHFEIKEEWLEDEVKS